MRVSDETLEWMIDTYENVAGEPAPEHMLDLRDARALLREAERGLQLDERAIDDNLALAERIRQYLGAEP